MKDLSKGKQTEDKSGVVPYVVWWPHLSVICRESSSVKKVKVRRTTGVGGKDV